MRRTGIAAAALAALLLTPAVGRAQEDPAPPPAAAPSGAPEAAEPPAAAPADAPPTGPAEADAPTGPPPGETAAPAPTAKAAAPVGAPPVPSELTLEDTPNDSGYGLVFRFPAAEGESPDFVYRLLLAPSKDGPFQQVARVVSTAGMAEDAQGIYGWSAKGMEGHAVPVTPLDLYNAEQFAQAILPDEEGKVDEALKTKLQADLGADTFEAVEAVFEGAALTKAKDNNGHVRDGYFGTDKQISRLIIDRKWYGKIEVLAGDQPVAVVGTIAEGETSTNLFNLRKLSNLGVALILGALVMFIQRARKNPDMYLRRIGGLDAVDDALGRATEMGKPVLFVHGLREMKEVSTIAAVNILGEIAKHTAKFDSKLLCATYDPIVLGVSQETVQESYTSAGRPDAYQEDDVFLAGGDQFSYVAAVDGIMLRQKPAANFYCGYFYAESLILAETGALSGAIQIAATDSFTQLPFFVTTCDYTLMGEELYAASAYLSRDPLLLGSLKGQDYAKLLMIVLVVGGIVLETMGIHWLRELIKPY